MISMGLVEYSSSDESENENRGNEKQEDIEKTPRSLENCGVTKSVTQEKVPKLQKLPVPNDIQCLFSGKKRTSLDDPTRHEGRIRSFAHEEGNWATSVFVPTDFGEDEDFVKLQEQLFHCLQPLEFNTMKDYHVSLSRTVVIRHHWIQELKQSLEKEFKNLLPCACEIDGVKVYVNDENTRSFLGLQVTATDNRLNDYVNIVDKCFEGYKLEKYYKTPSFHISIGWCLGNVAQQVTKKMDQNMKEALHTCLTELDDGGFFLVDRVVLKTGNKEFVFPLQAPR